MALREDIVTSAVNFLQDPNVAASSLENKVSFLRSKNLTQEEIDASLARAGAPPSAVASSHAVAAPVQQQAYYAQYPQQPYGWQPPPPPPPKRDWRDWFIMATVVGGVSYGLYFITQRYIYPLVAPPTPEKLEQDKAAVDEQFEKTFATLEQLSKDTEALKTSEAERSEKVDKIVAELENFMRDARSASRRQEDDTDRLRDEMRSLKDGIPKSLSANKDFTDGRLRDIANEVKSLKALMGQRMATPSPTPVTSSGTTSNYLRPTSGNAAPASPATIPATTPTADAGTKENGDAMVAANGDAAPESSKKDYLSSLGGRSSPFGSGLPAAKASIPAWQMAMANKSSGNDSASGAQQESGSSSS